jgi:hypothetical protein
LRLSPLKFLPLSALLLTAASAGDLPNTRLTPGAVRPLTHKTICSTIWSRDRRFVTARMKLQVYRSYGMIGPKDKACVPDAHGRRCEIDHLIPRSLGGADDVKNLWPQPFGTKPWNAARKDRLEVRLSKDVCSGKIKLVTARRWLVRDYRVSYVRLIGKP